MLHYIDLHTDNSYLWRPQFTFIVNSTIDCAWHTLLDKTTSDSGIVICNYRYVLHYYVWCDIFMVKIQFLINKRMLNWVYMNSDSIREIFDQQLNYDQSLRSYFENFFFLLVNRGKNVSVWRRDDGNTQWSTIASDLLRKDLNIYLYFQYTF